MNEKTVAETQKIIELAQQGNWIPAAIVAGFLGLIITLLLYIYRKDRTDSNKRHEENERLMAKSIENQSTMSLILTELQTDSKAKDRELRDLKIDVKENRTDIKNIMK